MWWRVRENPSNLCRRPGGEAWRPATSAQYQRAPGIEPAVDLHPDCSLNGDTEPESAGKLRIQFLVHRTVRDGLGKVVLGWVGAQPLDD
jgi:hypothetical protein